MTCPCGPQWRVESAPLKTGITSAVLPAVSFDLGEALDASAVGTLVFHAEDINIADVWPHLMGLWVLRDNVCVWAGMSDSFTVKDNTVTVGCLTMDGYLSYRKIREQLMFSQQSQTVMGASLVEYARMNNGIRLYGETAPSAQLRDSTYNAWDRAQVLSSMQDIAGLENGPDWVLRYEKDENGAWRAFTTWVDYAGGDQGTVLIGGVHLDGLDLTVDAKEHATTVDAIGDGQEADTLIASAQAANSYPQFDSDPAFKTVQDEATLQAHANGELQQHSEPTATPKLVVVEHSQPIGMGDTIYVDAGFGAATYRGYSRVVGWTWRAAAGEPDRRELLTTPIDGATTAMLSQTPRACEGC